MTSQVEGTLEPRLSSKNSPSESHWGGVINNYPTTLEQLTFLSDYFITRYSLLPLLPAPELLNYGCQLITIILWLVVPTTES